MDSSITEGLYRFRLLLLGPTLLSSTKNIRDVPTPAAPAIAVMGNSGSAPQPTPLQVRTGAASG